MKNLFYGAYDKFCAAYVAYLL